MRGREDHHLVKVPEHLPGEHVKAGHPLDFVAEQLDPDGVFLIGRVHLDRVAPDAKASPHEVLVIALVVHLDEVSEDRPLVVQLAGVHHEDAVPVLLRGPEAIDARDGCHHDDVAPREQAGGGGVAQPVDLVVDGGVLLDVGVRRRQVGLGLVVVVVGDEVLHPVLREEGPELAGQLSGE